MPRLLVVHHTASPATRTLLEEVLAGANHPDLEGAVEVVDRPALVASAVETLEADGYLLGCPANIGYMAGAMKHYLDTVYYPCLGQTDGRPLGLWVHGNDDTAGAVRALTAITGALGWKLAAEPLSVTAPIDATTRAACRDLGATLAASLL
ncbi:flavodoxin family protein [Spongisporangium articulatum]|uniref:Flavodoxin family protein n=1 Tax=Spongisporangium articulatum TaxID=3362603 RepID=A0ABW8ANQ7_9ACTN